VDTTLEGVAFLLVLRPLNVSALDDAASGAAAAYGAGLRGGFAALVGVPPEFVLISGATGGATGATLAFSDAHPINAANNSRALDEAVDALAGASPSGTPAPSPAAAEGGGGRRLGGPPPRRRRAEVQMAPVPPPAPLRAGEAGVSFTVITPDGAAPVAAALKALGPAAYAALNASLLAATAGLPNAPSAFALSVPPASVTVVAVTRRRWAVFLDFLRSRLAAAVGGGGALMCLALGLGVYRCRALRARARVHAGRRLAAAGKKADAAAALRRKIVRVRAFNALRKWARYTVTLKEMHVRAVLNPSPRGGGAAAWLGGDPPPTSGGGGEGASAPRLDTIAEEPTARTSTGSPGGAGFPPTEADDSAAVPPPPRRSPPVRHSPLPAALAPGLSPGAARPPAAPSPTARPLAPIAAPLAAASPSPPRARARTPPPPLGAPGGSGGGRARVGGGGAAAAGSRLNDAAPLTGARWGPASPYAAAVGNTDSPLLNIPGSSRGQPLSAGALANTGLSASARLLRGGGLGASGGSGSSRGSAVSALDGSPANPAHRSVLLNFTSRSPVGDGAQAAVGASPPAALLRGAGGGAAAAYARAAAAGASRGSLVSVSRLPALRPDASRAGSSVGSAHSNYASRASSRGTIGRAGATTLAGGGGGGGARGAAAASALAADPAALAATSAGTARNAGAAAARSTAAAARAAAGRGSASSPGGAAGGGFVPPPPPPGQPPARLQLQQGAAAFERPDTGSDAGEEARGFDV